VQIEPGQMPIAVAHPGLGRAKAVAVQWSVHGALAVLWLTAALLGWRRLAGALERPLEPVALLVVTLATAGVAAAVHWAWHRRIVQLPHPRLNRAVPWSIPVALAGIGLALSLPGTSPWGLGFFWAVVLGEEIGAWFRRPTAPRRLIGWPETRVPPEPPEVPEPVVPPPSVPRAAEVAPPGASFPSGDVLQQLTRRRATDGGETLTGWLRVPLVPGQRIANVHVAFCPPFPRTPQVAVEQLEGPAGRIKKVQVLPYGARFDLKLAEPAEMASAVLLEFAAHCGPAGAPSAAPTGAEGEPTAGE